MSKFDQLAKLQAALVLGNSARARIGLVTAYNPSTYAVKATIQPEGIETGWLPVMSLLVGPQWGLLTAPSVGNQVLILFQENDPKTGIVIGCLFSLADQPPGKAQPGEFWVVHSTGSLLKFTADGKVALTSNGDLNVTAGGKIVAQASEMDLTGNLKVTGDITGTGTVTGNTDVKTGTVSLKGHVHPGVTSGPSLTGLPQ